MADLNLTPKEAGKPGRTKKMPGKIDFTPMVDLGFLLITFFMLTTSLIKPQTMEIAMPSKDASGKQTEVPFSRALTIILGKHNKVIYYSGTRDKAGKDPVIHITDFSPDGLRKMLLNRNSQVIDQINLLQKQELTSKLTKAEINAKIAQIKKDKSSPIVMIKATDNATYKNLVDALDEMLICYIGCYSVIDINSYDLSLIKNSDT